MFKKLISVGLSLLFLCSAAFNTGAMIPPESVSRTYENSPFYEKLQNVELTGDMRKDIVAVAESQIGYREGDNIYEIDGMSENGSGDFTEYHNFMNYPNGQGGWCGMFVSFCAAMAGIPQTILKRSVSAKPNTSYGFGFSGPYKLPNADIKGFYDLVPKGGTYLPKPGDVIFFGYSNNQSDLDSITYKHVGLVHSSYLEYNEDGTVNQMVFQTIEGNYSEQVKKNTYKIKKGSSGWVYDDTYIAAFGIPDYKVESAPRSASFDMGNFDGATISVNHDYKGPKVILLEQALAVLSLSNDSLRYNKVDNYFDHYDADAVRAFQRSHFLSPDGIVGKETWEAIRNEVIEYTSHVESEFILKGNEAIVFKGKSRNTKVPEGVTALGAYLFYKIDTLDHLTLPSSIEFMGESAFLSTSLLQITYEGREEEFRQIQKGMGNEELKNIPIEFVPNVYEITFDIEGVLYKTTCKKNEIPVCPVTPLKEEDQNYVYHFTSFDKPLAPATEDTVYRALFLASPNCITTISANSVKSYKNSEFQLDLSLSHVPDFIGISELSFSLMYSVFTPFLELVPEKTTMIPELQMTDDGSSFHFSLLEGAGIYADTVLVSLHFKVKMELPQMVEWQTEIEKVSISDGVNHYPQKFESLPFVLDTSYTNFYDLDGSGSLSIADVTALLNRLAGVTNDALMPTPFDEPLSIGNVTELLNLLSKESS